MSVQITLEQTLDWISDAFLTEGNETHSRTPYSGHKKLLLKANPDQGHPLSPPPSLAEQGWQTCRHDNQTVHPYQIYDFQSTCFINAMFRQSR